MEVLEKILLQAVSDHHYPQGSEMTHSPVVLKYADICTDWGALLSAPRHCWNPLFAMAVLIEFEKRTSRIRTPASSVRSIREKVAAYLQTRARSSDRVFLRFKNNELRKNAEFMLGPVLAGSKRWWEVDVQIGVESDPFNFWPIFSGLLAGAERLTTLTLYSPARGASSGPAAEAVNLNRVQDATFAGFLPDSIRTPNATDVVLREMEIGGPSALRRFLVGVPNATTLTLVAVRATPESEGAFRDCAAAEGQASGPIDENAVGGLWPLDLSIRIRRGNDPAKRPAKRAPPIIFDDGYSSAPPTAPESDGDDPDKSGKYVDPEEKKQRIVTDLDGDGGVESKDRRALRVAQYVLSLARPRLRTFRIEDYSADALMSVVKQLGPNYTRLERLELWRPTRSNASDEMTGRLLICVAEKILDRSLRPRGGILFGGMVVTAIEIASAVEKMWSITESGPAVPIDFADCDVFCENLEPDKRATWRPGRLPCAPFRIHPEVGKGVMELTQIRSQIDAPACNTIPTKAAAESTLERCKCILTCRPGFATHR